MEGCETIKEKKILRVSEVQRDRYTLLGDTGEIYGKLKGSLYHNKQYPVVGDYVEVSCNPQGDSLIERICERRTYLSRPDRSGHADGYVKTLVEQPMAANFDYVFIVTSLNQNFNSGRIARYIAVTIQGGGVPVVILSKADLCENAEHYIAEVKGISDKTDVIAISAVTGEGMAQLQSYFKEGVTIALIGSSGVGKSTMLNAIAGKEVMKTGGIREEDGKGRHTTTHRQLFVLENGITIIDTPGMREIGVCDIDDGIEDTFSDVTELFTKCRFGNCRHDTEPDCAVKRALQTGKLSEKRWRMYVRLHQENTRAKRMKARYINGHSV